MKEMDSSIFQEQYAGQMARLKSDHVKMRKVGDGADGGKEGTATPRL